MALVRVTQIACIAISGADFIDAAIHANENLRLGQDYHGIPLPGAFDPDSTVTALYYDVATTTYNIFATYTALIDL